MTEYSGINEEGDFYTCRNVRKSRTPKTCFGVIEGDEQIPAHEIPIGSPYTRWWWPGSRHRIACEKCNEILLEYWSGA